MREMMSVMLEGVLDGELEEELGYSKYNDKNKDTDNARNRYSPKTIPANGQVTDKIGAKYLHRLCAILRNGSKILNKSLRIL